MFNTNFVFTFCSANHFPPFNPRKVFIFCDQLQGTVAWDFYKRCFFHGLIHPGLHRENFTYMSQISSLQKCKKYKGPWKLLSTTYMVCTVNHNHYFHLYNSFSCKYFSCNNVMFTSIFLRKICEQVNIFCETENICESKSLVKLAYFCKTFVFLENGIALSWKP